MARFKKGDKIRRLQGGNSLLNVGAVYTVAVSSHRYVTLDEHPDMGCCWEKGLFELVDSSNYHPHHDVICAWARGEEIESYSTVGSKWVRVYYPSWGRHYEYRVKPARSEAELEIERIEGEMHKLSDALVKARAAL